MSEFSDLSSRSIRLARRSVSAKLLTNLSLSQELSQLEADVLLVEAYKRQGEPNFNRAKIFANLDEVLEANVALEYENLVSSRLEGRPVAYILGVQEFYGYQFLVNEHTLIPRPETELLVESLLSLSNPYRDPVFLDIGTGSGAILISVLLEKMKRTDCRRVLAVGSDISKEALHVAQKNSQKHNLDGKLEFVQASMLSSFNLEPFSRRPLFLVSNPPYIDASDSNTCEFVRKYEPASALFSPDEGLFHIKTLIEQYVSICSVWENAVYLLLEVGLGQANKIKCWAESLRMLVADGMSGELVAEADRPKLSILKDLSTIDRILVFSCNV